MSRLIDFCCVGFHFIQIFIFWAYLTKQFSHLAFTTIEQSRTVITSDDDKFFMYIYFDISSPSGSYVTREIFLLFFFAILCGAQNLRA